MTPTPPAFPANRPPMIQVSEAIRAHLEEEGYRVEIDQDGDVVFRCEGLAFLLSLQSDGQPWGNLMVPFVWEIDEESPIDRKNVMQAMDFINRRSKLVKAYATQQRVHMSVQIAAASVDEWLAVLPRCIRALSEARTLLVNAIRLPELATMDMVRQEGGAAPAVETRDEPGSESSLQN